MYRCLVRGRQDHFASNEAGCEGQTLEFGLGYALKRPPRCCGSDALDRHPPVGAGEPPAGAGFEFGLGFLLGEGGSGRHPIYGCMSGGADFPLAGPGL